MFLMLLISALIIGLSLGLLGAGGSILTVPALMLLIGLDEKSAIASSLFIVAGIACVGAIKALKSKALNLKVLGAFGLSSLPAAGVGAHIGVLLPNGGQTLLLIAIMLFSASKMLRAKGAGQPGELNLKVVFLSGIGAGLLTGIVGIGGGFLIVPALVLFAGLSMQQATANSLALITLNGGGAFVTLFASSQMPSLDWQIIAVMTGVGAVSVWVGQGISAKMNQKLLKRCFGVLLIMVAATLAYGLINQ